MFPKKIFFSFFCYISLLSSTVSTTQLFSMQTTPDRIDNEKQHVTELLLTDLDAAKHKRQSLKIQRIKDLLDLGAALYFSEEEKKILLSEIVAQIKNYARHTDLEDIRIRLFYSRLITMPQTFEVHTFLELARERVFLSQCRTSTSTTKRKNTRSNSSCSTSSNSNTAKRLHNNVQQELIPLALFIPVLVIPVVPYVIQEQPLISTKSASTFTSSETSAKEKRVYRAEVIKQKSRLEADSASLSHPVQPSAPSENELRSKRKLEKSPDEEDTKTSKQRLLSPINSLDSTANQAGDEPETLTNKTESKPCVEEDDTESYILSYEQFCNLSLPSSPNALFFWD